MIQFNINQKPLSVNEAYRGRRFRTKAYIEFERCMLLKMPKGKIDPEQMLRVELFFGFSTKSADIDNPIKATLDLAQKKYGFNDKMVFELNVRKCLVKKGDEFISMGIFKMLPF
jgi:Holliday junction resolvase RusA-like endonuclease